MNPNYFNTNAHENEVKKIAIFDLDGCLSDDSWRLPLILPEGSDDRFVLYHDGINKDIPLTHGIAALKRHITDGDWIVFITARPEYTRKDTTGWLHKHAQELTSVGFSLYMRPSKDEATSSVDLKKDILNRLLNAMHSQQSIVAAYDDREDVVNMYREHGINAAVLDYVGHFPKLAVEAPSINDERGEVTDEFSNPPVELIEAAQKSLASFQPKQILTAADILESAGATFRERNAVYKDNADNVGKVMAALFPNGVQLKSNSDHKMYHLFELLVVKLTRFANSNLSHKDSIHDLMVYAAMCENLTESHNIKFENLEKK